MLSIDEYICLFMSKLFCLILHTCVILSLFCFIQPYFYLLLSGYFGKCQTCFIYLAMFIYLCPAILPHHPFLYSPVCSALFRLICIYCCQASWQVLDMLFMLTYTYLFMSNLFYLILPFHIL
jgi:hypothetical protein